MTFLSEDPSFLMVVLVLVAGAFLVALKVTQQAKYLLWALGTLGLAAILMVVELLWVTDAERIEQVVFDLRRAVLASDVEGVLAHLTPDVEYGQGGTYLSGEATRELIRANLTNATFDFVHINGLQTSAGRNNATGEGGVSGLCEGHVADVAGHLQCGNSEFNLVSRLSRDCTGYLEGKPDHAGIDARRDNPCSSRDTLSQRSKTRALEAIGIAEHDHSSG